MRGWQLWSKVLWGMVPSVVLIFLVLGTIFMGIATPTEAGALGAVGAVILAALHRRLTWTLVRQAMESTMRLSAMVMFILIGSTVFSLVFQGVDGNVWVEHMLTDLPGGPLGFLIAVNLFVFFLAFFLDFFEIAFIIVPLLAPVADKVLQPLLPPGAPPEAAVIWFGIVLCVNMQTSFMHPPFGFALFYLRGIADQIFKNKTIPRPILSKDIYLGSIPWVIMQLVLVAVVIAWPGSVTYWLGTAEKIDLDKASETLRQMGGAATRGASDDAGTRCFGRRRRPPRPTRWKRSAARCSRTPTRRSRRRRRAKKRPRPLAIGACAPPEGGSIGQSFCCCMKSSNPDSVKRNQRLASRRNAEKSS